ncbi:hypothetical protein ACOSQ3_008912 [Xanthoceras sorbifolium]
MKIANALTYFQIRFSRPIVFRTMQPENILFDEQNIAEVPDFTLSESISEGKTHVSGRVAGALGLIAPGYMLIGLCNEKSDVFSFSVLLLVLLTGQRIYDRSRRETGDDYWLLPHVKKYNENNRFYEIVDPAISLDMDCVLEKSSNCKLLHVLPLNVPLNHRMIGQRWLMLQNNSDKYIDQRTGLLMIIFTVLVNPILRIAMETANALALYPVASDQQEYCWMNSL